MSLLNSDQSNFIISLPDNWLFDEIIQKYTPFLERVHQPYKKLIEFINATIQSVTFPEFSTNTVKQFDSNSIRIHRDGFDGYVANNRSITITFRTVSGFINYFVMQEQMLQFYSYKNSTSVLPPIRLTILDDYGHNLVTFTLKNTVISKISGLDLSYSSDTPEFRSFTLDIAYSDFEISSDFNSPTIDRVSNEKNYLRIR